MQEAMQLHPGRPRTLAYQQPLRTDLKLLELSESVLQEVLAGSAVFKGGPDEEAVLCTLNTTYAVKTVETTNSLLLVAPDTGAAASPTMVRSPLTQRNKEADQQAIRASTGMGLQTQLQQHRANTCRSNPVVATATACQHLEITVTAPRLDMLDALLQECPFGLQEEGSQERVRQEAAAGSAGSSDGDDDVDDASREEGGACASAMEVDSLSVLQGGSGGYGAPGGTDGSGRSYSFDELLGRVQASEQQLLSALEERGALLLDGRWRVLDPSYMGSILEVLLCTAVERGWCREDDEEGDSAVRGRWRVNVGDALDAMQHEFDPRLVAHCLRIHGELQTDGYNNGNINPPPPSGYLPVEPDRRQMYMLQDDKVCRYYARKLLAQQPRWPLDEFMKAWRREVPEGMELVLDVLRAEALEEQQASGGGGGDGKGGGVVGGGRCLVALRAEGLPQEPAARFKALFGQRPRWLWRDLEPYVKGLQAPGQSAEAVLLKYTRAVQPRASDQVVYTQR